SARPLRPRLRAVRRSHRPRDRGGRHRRARPRPLHDGDGDGQVRRRLLEEIGASILALLVALFVGGLLILLAGENPFSIYAELFAGTLGSWYGIGQMLGKATPLLFTGLSVGLAFRVGLFNI